MSIVIGILSDPLTNASEVFFFQKGDEFGDFKVTNVRKDTDVNRTTNAVSLKFI
jgi:hypothetical protein